MLSDELTNFINEQTAYLTSLNTDEYNADIEKRSYAQTVKLSEEVGELCEAILAHFNNQKRDKNGKEYSKEGEVADVMITLLILCQHLKIDASKALETKIKVITERRQESS